ncbi:transcriptional regulator [Calothrix sp. HK-06]|nr:transcriptional regulator [Calothrix sp. HK-06]
MTKNQPQTITTEKQNDEAIALAQDLEHRINRTPEEETLLQLLVTLIEKFEENHYPIPKGTGNSMLLHLMEARSLKPEALIEIIGSKEAVLEIIEKKRNISNFQAKALSNFFQVDINLFL